MRERAWGSGFFGLRFGAEGLGFDGLTRVSWFEIQGVGFWGLGLGLWSFVFCFFSLCAVGGLPGRTAVALCDQY